MNNDGKKKRNVGLFCFLTFLAFIIVLGAGLYWRGYSVSEEDSVYVFDGWNYGREDQKKACAALAAAGLDDYSWESGKLKAPVSKKNAYQAALAGVGAYPKAPSESRGLALREMSAFESDAKSRMRELDACALQLERTIEQMRGVEYATVGVRSRREQVGLVAKNIVTASVGVAYKEAFNLDADALVAITMATKRQLGIEDDNNVSIIDLREGKSYLGNEQTKQIANNGGKREQERERFEKYWRTKYLEAFSDVKNIRVSVEADVVEISDADEGDVSVESLKEVAENGKERVKSVNYISEKKLPNLSRDNTNNENRCSRSNGFAQLGNPVSPSSDHGIKQQDVQNESVNGLLANRNEQAPGVLQEALGDAVVIGDLRASKNLEKGLGRHNGKEADVPRLVVAAMRREESHDGLNNKGIVRKRSSLGLSETLGSAHGKSSSSIRQANVIERAEIKSNSVSSCPVAYALRTIVVHICIPRSYITFAARQAASGVAKETFASNVDDRLLYSVTEERIFNETKQYAITLFKPTGDRLGWNEDDLAQCFVVDSYYDVDSFGDSELQTKTESKSSAHFGSFDSNSKSFDGEEIKVDSADDGVVEDWLPDSDLDKAEVNSASTSLGNDMSSYGTRANTAGKIADISTALDEVEVDERAVEENSMSEEDGSIPFDVSSLLNADFWRRDEGMGRIVVAVLATLLCVVGLCIIFKRNRLHSRNKIENKNNDCDTATDANDSKREKTIKKSKTNSPSMDYDSYFDGLDEDEINDELEGELRYYEQQRQNVKGESATAIDDDTIVDDEYARKRKEALELIARYPERAAASLQNWVTGAET